MEDTPVAVKLSQPGKPWKVRYNQIVVPYREREPHSSVYKLLQSPLKL